MTKIGECYFRDENGNLWLAISYVNENEVVTTQNILIEEHFFQD